MAIFSTGGRSKTLFAKMWRLLLLVLVLTFAVNAFLVKGALHLGSDFQTERRLQHIGDYWSKQAKLEAPLGIDPITVIYPRHELLPPELQRTLSPDKRGIIEFENRDLDYYVLAQSHATGGAFYVVESHGEVKPDESIESQVFLWYLAGIVPFGLLLLWLCQRITGRVTSRMMEVGRLVSARDPTSLEKVALPANAPVEIESLVVQINSALQRTSDALDRERSFTRFASHELRTPAAIVQAALERIEAHGKPEQRPAIERAHRGLRDMHALIDTFLQLSGDKVRPVSDALLIDEAWVRSLIRHLMGERPSHEFSVLERHPLLLSAPATTVHVLVANMLKNAVFHGGPDCIEVIVEECGIEVRNGLPDTPSTGGYGLGTQIAHRICERFGWTFKLTVGERLAVARLCVPASGRPDPA
jgi:signal transduction histidine kinase